MRIITTLFGTLALGAVLTAPVAAETLWPAQGKYFDQQTGYWVSPSPRYVPGLRYYAPPPRYYAPLPRYYRPPHFYYAPPPVYFAPPPPRYFYPPPRRYYRPGPPGVGLYFRF